MLTLTEQKKRIEKVLNNYPIHWQKYEETPSRYRLLKPNNNKASLWLAITLRNEAFTIATTGDLTADLESFVKRLIGSPALSSGKYREWRKVSYESACEIINEFSNHFAIKTKSHLSEKVTKPFIDTEHLYPDEVPSNLKEGSKKTITVNSYERNPKAREECIKKYGVSCTICDFNFKNTYGSRGEGFIHVHHLIAVSDIGEEYEVDPVKDLRPVCPNCHAMLHRKGNISIEELLSEINSNK